MYLPQVRTAFTTSCGNRRCTEELCFRISKACLIQLKRVLIGLQKAYRICTEVFLQKRSVTMMGIESMIHSNQWAPPYPFRKWHGLILCWTPSFPRLGLLDHKFWSNQFSVVRSLEYSLDCLRTHLWGLLFFSDMSTSVRFRSGSHQFPGCSFHFRGVFRIVSQSCSALPSRTLFPDAWNVFVKNRLLRLSLLLLLLRSAITLQRDLGCLPCCCEPLEY